MSRRNNLTEKQRKQRQEFVTHTVDRQFKIEEHSTEFETLINKLHRTMENCHESSEVREWVVSHRNSKWIPEPILRRMGVKTIFDEGEHLAPYSLTESGVVLEPASLEEIEEVEEDATTQKQAA
jgi:hypothetical protein